MKKTTLLSLFAASTLLAAPQALHNDTKTGVVAETPVKLNLDQLYINGVKFNRKFTDLDFTASNLTSIATRNFSDLQNKPTTVAGYGITDAAHNGANSDIASLSDSNGKLVLDLTGGKLKVWYPLAAQYVTILDWSDPSNIRFPASVGFPTGLSYTDPSHHQIGAFIAGDNVGSLKDNGDLSWYGDANGLWLYAIRAVGGANDLVDVFVTPGEGIAFPLGISDNKTNALTSINSAQREAVADDGATVVFDWSDPTKLSLGTDIALAFAGTGAATTRTNLGLVIGTNVQAYDADLDTWSGITPGTGVGTALGVNVGSAGAFGRQVAAPSTSSSTGTAGDYSYDSSFFYICTASNTWKRVAIASW